MMIQKLLYKLFLKLQLINDILGRSISWFTLFIVLITFAVVVLRYGFNTGWIALQESAIYLYACLFLLGIAYTYQHDGHVRVDIFYANFSVRNKAWVNLLGILILLLPMVGFIFYISWDFVMASWQIKEQSGEAGGLAYVYLLKSQILLMAFFVTIEAIAQLLKNIDSLFFEPQKTHQTQNKI